MKVFALRDDSAKETLEIDVLDIIGRGFMFEGVTAQSVVTALKASKSKKVYVRVNSRGGDVAEAEAIAAALRERASNGSTVEVAVLGLAASAATIIANAGDDVAISRGAFVMAHNASTGGPGRGTVEDHERAIEMLKLIDANLLDMYVRASARRGKNKDAAEFRKAMKAERYFSAAEAVEWGLADRVIDDVQIAACADLSSLTNAPAGLLEIYERIKAEAAAPEIIPPTPEVPAAATPENLGTEKTAMTINKEILQALALADDADQAAIVSAITKLRTSAHVGSEIEKLTGCNGAQALGAVRALQEAKAQHDELAGEVAKLKDAGARRDFEAARAQGLKDKKLTPAQAKHYTDRFEAALATGQDASAIVDDLSGWLKVATRVIGSDVRQPAGAGPDPVAQHNGKAFEAMSGTERHALKRESPELYETLRSDAVIRRAV